MIKKLKRRSVAFVALVFLLLVNFAGPAQQVTGRTGSAVRAAGLCPRSPTRGRATILSTNTA